MAKSKKAFDYAGWEKKEKIKVGDVVTFAAEINGPSKGSKAEVQAIQGGGAVFVVKVINGPLTAGGKNPVLRVKASDLL